jgi:hypothetical protein
MKTETLSPQNEISTTNPVGGETAASPRGPDFASARTMLYQVSSDSRVFDRLPNPDNPYADPAEYWNAVAELGREKTEPIRDNLRKAEKSASHLDAFELVTATPAAAYASAVTHDRTAPFAERQKAAETVNDYKARLIRFAHDFPTTRSEQLSKELLTVANIAVESPDVLASSSQNINRLIREARHHAAFEAIVNQTGRTYDTATIHGSRPGVVTAVEGEHKKLEIEVVPTTGRLERLGEIATAYVTRPDDRIVMHSLTNESEFGGRMLPPSAIAEAKADTLNELLAEAELGQSVA